MYDVLHFCVKTRIFAKVKNNRSSPLLNGDYPTVHQDYLSKVNAISLSLSWLKYMINNILTFARADCRVSTMFARNALIKELCSQIGIDN